MKKIKKLLYPHYFVLLLMSCIVIFYACKKTNADSVTKLEKSKVDAARTQKLTIESLVDTMFSETTNKNDSRFFIQYMSLTPQELEKYNEVALNKTCKLMKQKEGYTLSENEKQQRLLMLKEFNNLSLRTFKKSYNALTSDELSSLETHTSGLVPACSSYNFPLRGREATSYNINCSAVDRAATPDKPADCDYQLKFTGFNYSAATVNVLANSYLLHGVFKYRWNNYQDLILRQSGSDIYLLVGNRITYLIPAPTDWYLKNYVAIKKP